MESKNKTVLMSVIDGVLEEIVWVGKSGAAISLKEAIAANMKGADSADIGSLSRDDLIGAYTAFQIRRQSFSESTRDMADSEIAAKIKSFVFDDTRERMALVERELSPRSQARRTA
ncbi:MAG: hypothetical protein LBI17_03770 [Rickettsiales bacterium]|jgi:hypothetical protein|nr:hypothetical protein [Rickettsiales bacterium]